jgi:hypothetical protein
MFFGVLSLIYHRSITIESLISRALRASFGASTYIVRGPKSTNDDCALAHRRLYERARRFLFAALGPSLPSAVLVFFGRCATVRFRLAALAALLMLRRAAERCLAVAMPYSSVSVELFDWPSLLPQRRCAAAARCTSSVV